MTMILGALLTVVVVVVVLRLVARRQLLVKYAVLWVAVACLLSVLAIFPTLLAWLAGVLGFEVPSNMLFFAAIVLLLAVTLQLSLEVSRIERRLQRVAEELALMGVSREPGDDPEKDPEAA
jgi:hypothetical protein